MLDLSVLDHGTALVACAIGKHHWNLDTSETFLYSSDLKRPPKSRKVREVCLAWLYNNVSVSICILLYGHDCHGK